jgi:hypothetical protein
VRRLLYPIGRFYIKGKVVNVYMANTETAAFAGSFNASRSAAISRVPFGKEQSLVESLVESWSNHWETFA